jgi:methylglutaconyl-CoA hydratase
MITNPRFMLRKHIEQGILYLTLDRPDKRNALNRELVDMLSEAFVETAAMDQIRAVVLTGSGEVFSAGADLAALKTLQTAEYEENLDDSRALAALFEAMVRCPAPIIGAVNGHAIAGGCGLATLCDITVAVETARFGYTETRIGFVPALVARFLMPKVGETQSRRLLLGGELISAEEARAIGLVTECVGAAVFQARVDYWVAVFRSQVSPQAVRSTRALLREVSDMDWAQALEHASKVNASARGTSDCKKGIAAFLNKRPLSWD